MDHAACAAARGGDHRTPVLPDVPRVSESPPGVDVTSWTGVFAPKGTRPEVVGRLNRALGDALEGEALRATHAKLAYTGGWSTRTVDVLRQNDVETAAAREPDLASFAVPVFEADGASLGALVVSSRIGRHSAGAWASVRTVAAAEGLSGADAGAVGEPRGAGRDDRRRGAHRLRSGLA